MPRFPSTREFDRLTKISLAIFAFAVCVHFVLIFFSSYVGHVAWRSLLVDAASIGSLTSLVCICTASVGAARAFKKDNQKLVPLYRASRNSAFIFYAVSILVGIGLLEGGFDEEVGKGWLIAAAAAVSNTCWLIALRLLIPGLSLWLVFLVRGRSAHSHILAMTSPGKKNSVPQIRGLNRVLVVSTGLLCVSTIGSLVLVFLAAYLGDVAMSQEMERIAGQATLVILLSLMLATFGAARQFRKSPRCLVWLYRACRNTVFVLYVSYLLLFMTVAKNGIHVGDGRGWIFATAAAYFKTSIGWAVGLSVAWLSLWLVVLAKKYSAASFDR